MAVVQSSTAQRNAATAPLTTTNSLAPSTETTDPSTAELASSSSAAAGDVVPTEAPAAEATAPAEPAAEAIATEPVSVPEVPSTVMNVHVTHSLNVRARPGAGAVIGTVEPRSKYIGTETYAWVIERQGDYGKVVVPYSYPQREGWILLRGLHVAGSHVIVKASVSKHTITVYQNGKALFTSPGGMGAAATSTPPGRYFVTDMVSTGAAPNTGSYGHFAFGLSGRQPHLPSGWPPGHDQLAMHGTGDLGSIGRNQSTGCIRLAARTLNRLKPLLQLGTPVIIEP
jgi:lipoprotein-anchoring transpeptidase ErfK/SrfK